MSYPEIHQKVSRYYSEKISSFGPSARGVDWKDEGSQALRFERLIKLFNTEGQFSINDAGCGYGQFVQFLASQKLMFSYHGYDISREMIRACRPDTNAHYFLVENLNEMASADYCVASGLFNVKMDIGRTAWEPYILECLKVFSEKSHRGFSFNCLTSYSDHDKQRSDLYYADPCYFFDFCKKNFSSYVILDHGYPLYEFTLTVLF